MEQLNTDHVVGEQDTEYNDMRFRQLGLSAYRLALRKPTSTFSERFIRYELAMIAQKRDGIPLLTIGQQMLPIEFSEQGEQ
jgi:hypothetical protein